MTEFFENLTTSQTIFWGTAIVSSVFFVLQTIMTLVGIGGDSADASGMDADTGLSDDVVGSEAMQMFTVRNFVNFFLGFGWTGICLESVIPSTTLLTLCAIAVGLAFVALFIFIFKKLMTLEHSGNIDIDRDVIGREADVYLQIKAGSRGKVQLSINGSVREYDAVSTIAETIPTGARVKIVARQGVDALVVEKL